MAQAQPIHDAGRDRDDVFQRATKFDANDVVIRVEAQRRTGEFILQARSQFRVLARDGHRSGAACCNFLRKRWPAQHGAG